MAFILLSVMNITVSVFVETMILSWIESWKEQHLFEMEIFSNIINVLAVTFF